MKKFKMNFILFASFLLFLGLNIVAAQVKMKPEEADAKIKSLTTWVNELKAKQDQLKKDIETLNAKKTLRQTELEKCGEDIFSLIGATKEQIEAFKQKLEGVEKKINDLSRLSNKDLFDRKSEIDDVQKGADDLKGSKISLLPLFYDRVQALQGKIDNLKSSLVSTEKTYTVGTWAKDKDCLWNISKKPDIYDNPLLWPKIWQGNKDKIKDPDIIQPGQSLKIPSNAPLTEDETTAARKYWTKKKEESKKDLESQKEPPKEKLKEKKIEK
jgi:nucleoid-associated protein YgaU